MTNLSNVTSMTELSSLSATFGGILRPILWQRCQGLIREKNLKVYFATVAKVQLLGRMLSIFVEQNKRRDLLGLTKSLTFIANPPKKTLFLNNVDRNIFFKLLKHISY